MSKFPSPNHNQCHNGVNWLVFFLAICVGAMLIFCCVIILDNRTMIEKLDEIANRAPVVDERHDRMDGDYDEIKKLLLNQSGPPST